MSQYRLNTLLLAATGFLSALPACAGTLAQSPLTDQVSVPSNVMFALSVEYPTADTAAYPSGQGGYARTTTYQGIFDPDKCYDYPDLNAKPPPPDADQYFYPISHDTSRDCKGKWSGNFLNWAAMTGLDEFRVAMTGGNRFIDTPSLTVLERTYQSGAGAFTAKNKTYSGGLVSTPFTEKIRLVSFGLGPKMDVQVTSNNVSKGKFFIRAKVCDPSVGLEANCKKYGTNSYKPTGSIQKYGNQMRFGLLSYYLEDDNDNAVMRTRAKFVGPKQWTPTGEVDNPNKEWSETDGTFFMNPDSDDANHSFNGKVNNSGLINYINKFGIVGGTIKSGNSGTKFTHYKTYDDVGKLYYETLNYLQGTKKPTQAFYEKSSTANNEDFPVITTWDDPVQYACQKNFIITMGDSHAWCDKRLPGGLFGSAGGCGPYNGQARDSGMLADNGTGIDVGAFTNHMSAVEGVPYLGTTLSPNSNGSFYMSGLAYWAASTGFRPKPGSTDRMKLRSYIIDVQEPSNGVPDLGVGSQYWYAAKYGGATRFDSTTGKPYDATTTPGGTIPTEDSWWTTNPQLPNQKWPKTLLPAGNPDLMKKAVDEALQQIANQTASASAVTLSTNRLSGSSGINAFSTRYDSNGWSGDVLSYHIDSVNGLSATPTWKASTTLNPAALNSTNTTSPWKSRRVVTFNDGLKADGSDSTDANGRRGVEFRATNSAGGNDFTTQFSPRQQALLSQDPGTTPSPRGAGVDRVDYLRGENANEGNQGEQWRARTASIGDIIHSSAVYVRKSAYENIPYSDALSFRTYADAIANRTPVVYVGANDGMLHAFNASDNADDGISAPGATADSGKEMLAYVPAAVYGKLKALTSPSYKHQYFVDGTPVIADAQLSSARCTPSSDPYQCWRTVVTGGLKAGGQGVYALNATEPDKFATDSAASLVFWEFTDQDDPDLGYTFASPVVRKMNNGKWAVIFGNGYNNTDADGKASSDGRAYLYILMLDGPGIDGSGRGKKWTLGTDYFKIRLNAPGETGTVLSPANGLSTVFPIDRNGDGVTDYLYAGDRYGNLWKIDVRDANPANWGSAFGTTLNPQPLFSAVTPDSTPKKQQITTSPLVINNPNGGYMILFGTGSFNDSEDIVPPYDKESFYGIWDRDDGTRVTSRSQLQKQATLAYDASSGYSLQSNCGVQYSTVPTVPINAGLCPASLAPSANPNGTVNRQSGWVFDLNYSASSGNTGERYISDPLPTVDSGVLTFTTLTPSGDICNGSYTDFEYNLDPLTGGAAASPVYYNFTGSGATAISINFSYGGQSYAVPPSGKKSVGMGTGQNKGSYITPAGSSGAGNGTGCTNFIPGKPCATKYKRCDPTDNQCNKAVNGTGRIIWRTVTQ